MEIIPILRIAGQISRDNSRDIWIFFCNILEILSIYSTISRRTLFENKPDDGQLVAETCS